MARRYKVDIHEIVFVSANVPPVAPDGSVNITLVAGGESVLLDLIALGITDGGDGPNPPVLDPAFLGTLPAVSTGAGSVTMTAPNSVSLSFTASGVEIGTFTFPYTVTDGISTTTGEIEVHVLPPGVPVIAGAPVAVANGGGDTLYDPLGVLGDTCPGALPCGTACTVTFGPTQPAGFTDNLNGTFNYQPPAVLSGSGTDTVSYEIEDCYGQTTTGSIDFNWSDTPFNVGTPAPAALGPFAHDSTPPVIDLCDSSVLNVTGAVGTLFATKLSGPNVPGATATIAPGGCDLTYDPVDCDPTLATSDTITVELEDDAGIPQGPFTITIGLTPREAAPSLTTTTGPATANGVGTETFDAGAVVATPNNGGLLYAITNPGTGAVSNASVDAAGLVTFDTDNTATGNFEITITDSCGLSTPVTVTINVGGATPYSATGGTVGGPFLAHDAGLTPIDLCAATVFAGETGTGSVIQSVDSASSGTIGAVSGCSFDFTPDPCSTDTTATIGVTFVDAPGATTSSTTVTINLTPHTSPVAASADFNLTGPTTPPLSDSYNAAGDSSLGDTPYGTYSVVSYSGGVDSGTGPGNAPSFTGSTLNFDLRPTATADETIDWKFEDALGCESNTGTVTIKGITNTVFSVSGTGLTGPGYSVLTGPHQINVCQGGGDTDATYNNPAGAVTVTGVSLTNGQGSDAVALGPGACQITWTPDPCYAGGDPSPFATVTYDDTATTDTFDITLPKTTLYNANLTANNTSEGLASTGTGLSVFGSASGGNGAPYTWTDTTGAGVGTLNVTGFNTATGEFTYDSGATGGILRFSVFDGCDTKNGTINVTVAGAFNATAASNPGAFDAADPGGSGYNIEFCSSGNTTFANGGGTYLIVSAVATNGTVSGIGACDLTYTPDPCIPGTTSDTLTVTFEDGASGPQSVAVYTIDLTNPYLPMTFTDYNISDSPSASSSDTVPGPSVTSSRAKNFVTGALTVDGTIITSATMDTATGDFSYTASAVSGVGTITYDVDDGCNVDSGEINVTISAGFTVPDSNFTGANTDMQNATSLASICTNLSIPHSGATGPVSVTGGSMVDPSAGTIGAAFGCDLGITPNECYAGATFDVDVDFTDGSTTETARITFATTNAYVALSIPDDSATKPVSDGPFSFFPSPADGRPANLMGNWALGTVTDGSGSLNGAPTVNAATGELTYSTSANPGTATIEITGDDGCGSPVTMTYTVTVAAGVFSATAATMTASVSATGGVVNPINLCTDTDVVFSNAFPNNPPSVSAVSITTPGYGGSVSATFGCNISFTPDPCSDETSVTLSVTYDDGDETSSANVTINLTDAYPATGVTGTTNPTASGGPFPTSTAGQTFPSAGEFSGGRTGDYVYSPNGISGTGVASTAVDPNTGVVTFTTSGSPGTAIVKVQVTDGCTTDTVSFGVDVQATCTAASGSDDTFGSPTAIVLCVNDTTGKVTNGDVLSNDTGTNLQVTQVDGSSGNVGSNVAGTYGTLNLSAGGTFTYTGDPSTSGATGTVQDTFTYHVESQDAACSGESGPHTITFNVTNDGGECDPACTPAMGGSITVSGIKYCQASVPAFDPLQNSSGSPTLQLVGFGSGLTPVNAGPAGGTLDIPGATSNATYTPPATNTGNTQDTFGPFQAISTGCGPASGDFYITVNVDGGDDCVPSCTPFDADGTVSGGGTQRTKTEEWATPGLFSIDFNLTGDGAFSISTAFSYSGLPGEVDNVSANIAGSTLTINYRVLTPDPGGSVEGQVTDACTGDTLSFIVADDSL